MTEVIAILILLKGDMMFLMELEKFPTMESCREFAKMEYSAVVGIGHSGVGCAIKNADGTFEMKMVGKIKWR